MNEHHIDGGHLFAYILGPWLEYIEHRVDLSAVTKIEYARVAAHLRESAVVDVHDGCVDLAPFVAARRRAGAAPRTIALELRVASAACRWAQRTGLIGSSLFLRVPRVRIDGDSFVSNHRTPSVAEAEAAIDAMPRDDWRLAVLLMARTGARIGEVVRLRSADLDEHSGQVTLGSVVGASKTGKRRFPLDRDTWREFEGRSGRGNEPLFSFVGSGNRGRDRVVVAPIQALERRLNQACDRAGVPRFNPHGLRRMVVDRLLRSGVDPGTAATLTGHSVVVMLQFYEQVSDDDRRAAVEKANLSNRDPEDPEGSASSSR